jgi:hypothetical protein
MSDNAHAQRRDGITRASRSGLEEVTLEQLGAISVFILCRRGMRGF